MVRSHRLGGEHMRFDGRLVTIVAMSCVCVVPPRRVAIERLEAVAQQGCHIVERVGRPESVKREPRRPLDAGQRPDAFSCSVRSRASAPIADNHASVEFPRDVEPQVPVRAHRSAASNLTHGGRQRIGTVMGSQPAGICTSIFRSGIENPCTTSFDRITSRTRSPALTSIVAGSKANRAATI
jgi:hypothetical protein